MPAKIEAGTHLVRRRIVGRVIERAESPGCFLAEARVSGKEHFHQLAPLVLELPQLLVYRLQQRQGQEVNADFERQTRLVQVAPDVAVKHADGLKLRRA